MKKGEEVRIPDFGTFKVAKRKAREGRNPATGATDQDPRLARRQVHAVEGPQGPAELSFSPSIPSRVRHCIPSARPFA